MMNKLKLRTKIEVLITLFLIITIVAVTAASVTRVITDSNDNFQTFIRNSNGDYYEKSGDNIQNAIDDLGASGGTVWLPSGILVVNDDIFLKNDTTIIGAGKTSTTIKCSNGYTDSFLLKARRTGGVGPYNNITIKNLKIDCNGKNTCPVRFTDTTDGLIENVHIENSTVNGFYLVRCKKTIIRSCSARYCSSNVGMHSVALDDCKNCIFDSIIVTDNLGQQAVDVSGNDNCTFSNFIIKGGERGVKFFSDSGGYGGNNTVTNFHISVNGDSDDEIMKFTREHHTSISNIYITGTNEEDGIVIDGSDYLSFNNIHVLNCDIGIFSDDNVATPNHLTFNNIFIKNCADRGIYMPDTSDVLFSNLFIENIVGNNFGAIHIINSDNIYFSNCVVDNTANDYGGIMIDDTNDFSINSCEIINSDRGVYVADSCLHWKITDSSLRHNINEGIYIKNGGSTDYFIISNNDLTDNGGSGLNDLSGASNVVKSNNLS